ncbi:MAG: hypothetical protein REI94_10860 [Moraxellaceae bacterium]|nr:hypothetical protein [Moraxellaceae bacterium]
MLRLLSLVAFIALTQTGAQAAGAQDRDDGDFNAFMTQFRRAAEQGDVPALAAMTRTPFLYENRQLDSAAFARVAVPQLFTAKVRRCMNSASVHAEGMQRVVFCPPYAFYFGRSGNAYRLLEFAADGESMP